MKCHLLCTKNNSELRKMFMSARNVSNWVWRSELILLLLAHSRPLTTTVSVTTTPTELPTTHIGQDHAYWMLLNHMCEEFYDWGGRNWHDVQLLVHSHPQDTIRLLFERWPRLLNCRPPTLDATTPTELPPTHTGHDHAYRITDHPHWTRPRLLNYRPPTLDATTPTKCYWITDVWKFSDWGNLDRTWM